MPVIPLPQRHRNGKPAPRRLLNREARIHGTLRSPREVFGTMTGWLRLEPFQVVSDRLCAAGAFTGELLDSGGTTIGIGSRCRTIPAEIARSRATHGLRADSGARPARPRGAEVCFQRVRVPPCVEVPPWFLMRAYARPGAHRTTKERHTHERHRQDRERCPRN
jgi:hypothetical protein